MSKHTQGPWTQHKKSELSVVSGRVGIATCGGYSDNQRDPEQLQNEQTANARLIAAAPDLLDELENCADLLNMCFSNAPVDSCIGAALTKAKAAIAKATGQ